jgi:hypothetical protein
VPGYARTQSSANVALVASNKELEERCLRVIDHLLTLPTVDKRWLAIGRTELEKAWMDINRSIFRPERVRLPGDSQEG